MKKNTLMRLLLTFVLALSMMVTVVAYAQEGEATAEPTTETTDSHNEAAADQAEEGAAEEAVNPLVPLGINGGFLLAQIINFVVLFGLLGFLVWKPLTNMLDNRALTISKGLEDAAAAANARRNAEAEAEKILAGARAEAARVVEDSRARGEEVARQVAAEAQTDAEKIRAEGRTRATEERDRQLADLRGQVASIALAISQQLIGESLDEKRQNALISDFFTKVPVEARSFNGPVEVVSAMPLNDDEKSRVQKEVGGEITYGVDPSILGGLIVRSKDRVVDGSVRNNLNELGGRLR